VGRGLHTATPAVRRGIGWQGAQCMSAGFTPAGNIPRGLWTLLPPTGADKYWKLTGAARVAAGHTVSPQTRIHALDPAL